MGKYIITIEEIIDEDFEIVADNAKQAMRIAEDKYKSSEIILEKNNVSFRQMAVQKLNGDITDWFEF